VARGRLLFGFGGGEAVLAAPVVAYAEYGPIVTEEDDVLDAVAAFVVFALDADPVDGGLETEAEFFGVDVGHAAAGAF